MDIVIVIYGHIIRILILVVQFFVLIKDDDKLLILIRCQIIKILTSDVFQFFVRIQEVDDGFFEKFGHLKQSVETKEAIKDEENQERENYLDDDSSQDDSILDNLSLEDENVSKQACNVSFSFQLFS